MWHDNNQRENEEIARRTLYNNSTRHQSKQSEAPEMKVNDS